jgi:RNA polymerase sigma-70 factor (ECF subfamily)
MPIFAPDQFAHLLVQARGGSRDAVGQLLEPFRPYLGCGQLPAALETALAGHVETVDLVQDAFKAAIAAFAQFRGSTEGELFVWLKQILQRRAVNLAQRLRAKKRGGARPASLNSGFPDRAWHDMIIDNEDTPCTSTGSRELRAIMQRALLELKPHYQEVITLHYASEKTFAEIAAMKNTTTDAVMKRWKRALKAWRKMMEEMGVKEL